ncbi:MAG: PIN/TRAM domain-containing protein [Anaerolineae bacterium]|nr:TRAM domain-containing protein [Anaerolineales bacterium]MCQ3977357.1 PIN domain nuclease [Anaerolineae bacterium]
MSVEFVFRLVGMVVFAIIGVQSIKYFQPDNAEESTRLIIALTLAGAAIGLLVAPYLTIRPFNAMRAQLKQMPASHLLFGVLGLAVGLGVAALLYPPLSGLPEPYGSILPVAVSLLFGYIGLSVSIMRQRDILNTVGPRLTFGSSSLDFGHKSTEDAVLLDTSVIIDGRIADISKTGFIRSPMLVPHFVLNELQYIADSSDPIRRNRGRRGLDLLRRLQEESLAPVKITDIDVEGVKGADDKLVMLAKQLNCPIITNDFNLNSVAKLQGVVVLNINELANAVKTVILPHETINVKIIQEGKERDQGVAYLSDGTMIVVENGKHFIDQTADVTVTKVLQTSAGRMIFAKMER